ncbi:MAG: DUF1800 domain-containing protein [Steroidobacteraceae bacterium]|jgi:uncharacterized protein (DUF1800 family)
MTIDTAKQPAIAASRFGFGARPGELNDARTDPRGWLLAQLRTPYRAPAELDALSSSHDILASFLAARAARAAEKKAATREASTDDPVKQLFAGIRQQLLPHYQAQAAARTRIALASQSSFRERLVHFWSNHFAVSIDKPICLGTAGALENEAIRPRIDGRFADLLLAVETHPAMITYLDNQRSMGPNSALGVRAARRADGPAPGRIGLNENLAREILELHTLGVDGGYTQADVTTFAAVITGWSIGGGQGRYADGEPGAFVFRTALHEPGSKTVLGRRYAEGDMAQGKAVLRDLAAHPATARHIATKLARHFVADEPPAELVDRLAGAYRASEGHLPTVYGALVNWDGAWQSDTLKFKQPHEFIYSSLRALDVTPREPKALLAPFELLGQRHWSPGSPAGWPDREADWDGADALMQRIEWSVALADRVGDSHSALATADLALGALASPQTRKALANASSGSQGLALLLMSPEFQRR